MALAAAGIIGSAVPAKALVYTNSDLFVGFRATAGDGTEWAYLVNIGQASQFTAGTSFTLDAISAGIGADLTALYGDGWNLAGSTVSWGIFGANNTTTLYASKERTDLAAQSVPWANLGTNPRQSTASGILSAIAPWVNNAPAGGSGYTPVNLQAGIQSSTIGQGYVFQLTSGVTDFSSSSQWSDIEGSFANGVANSVLDLYSVNANTTYRGYFTINDQGIISFTTSAIPEPSTYALLVIAGTVALVALRRRHKLARA